MKNDREVNWIYISGARNDSSAARIRRSFMQIHRDRNQIYRAGVWIDLSNVKIDRADSTEGRAVPRGEGERDSVPRARRKVESVWAALSNGRSTATTEGGIDAYDGRGGEGRG